MTEKSGTSKKQLAASRTHRAELIKSYQQPSHTGGFSDLGYITTGPDAEHTDQYVKQEPIPSRFLGKNMTVKAPRSGHLPDVYFDKVYTTLASSTQGGPGADKYDPPQNRFREGKAEKMKIEASIKAVHHGTDFKLSNYPAPSTGPGSYSGCFQQKPFDHMPSDAVLPRGQPAKTKTTFEPRNFTTHPGPKGTFGVPNTTFGKFSSLYVSTPEMIAYRQKEELKWKKKKEAFEAAKKALLERPNFNGMIVTRSTFDEKKMTGTTGAYDEYEKTEEHKKRDEKEAKIRAKAQKKKARAEAAKNKGRKTVPLPEFMKYSSVTKSGEQGFFNKFPDQSVKPDESVLAERAKREAKKKAAEAKANKKKGHKDLTLGQWKPVSGPKSSVTVSLLPRYY